MHKPRYRHAKTAAPQFICGGSAKSLSQCSIQAGTVFPEESGNILAENSSIM